MPTRRNRSKQVRPADDQLWLDFESPPPTPPLQTTAVEEIYERADESLLLSLSEDERIERKSTKFGGDSLGEYFSMWANTSPDGGLIVCGQNDKSGFEGWEALSQEAINTREKTGYVHAPDARYKVRKVQVTNKSGKLDFVLLFRVEYHRDIVVKTSKGKVFVRKGDSKVELKSDEIKELESDKGQLSFERQPSGLSWPNKFDASATREFVESVRKARGLSERLSVEEVLEIRHLGEIEDGKFQPNIACALLFARDPLDIIPGCKIRFIRFEGEIEGSGEKYNAVKDEILEGTVPNLLGMAERVLKSQLRTYSPLDAKLKFIPVPEYPPDAWYEAIVNACVHRSYGNGMKNIPIYVKMFDDRLVVESPGPFPPFVNAKNIYQTHHPRNPHLMDAMFYLEYCKCAHEGTRRILDTMTGMGLPAPDFKQNDKDGTGPPTVTVTLQNKANQRRAWIDRDVSKIVSEALAADFSEEEKRVLNLAAEHGSITISDANKLLSISWQSAKRVLFGLAKKRVFQYVRFRPFKKNERDQRAFFRLRSTSPLPDGAFEQEDLTPLEQSIDDANLVEVKHENLSQGTKTHPFEPEDTGA